MTTDVSAPVSSTPAQGNLSPENSQKNGGENLPSPNMTGAEALAWVEAQKNGGKPPEKKADPYRTDSKPAQSSQETIKEAAAEAKRKLKIGDEEVDEEEVIKTYRDRKGHQQAANKILQEGKLARKQAEEFVTMMRDPEKFFEVAKKLGQDPRTLAEKYLATQLEEEIMDPRDKELRDAKRKLKAIEDMENEQKAQVERQRNEALKAKYAKDYSDQFVSALQETGLPPTKPMVAEMAKYIHRAAQLKFEMTATEAAQLVKEDILMAQQRLFKDTDGETLIKLLGPELANKVRKYDTSRVKNPEQFLRTPSEQPDPSQSRSRSQPKQRMSAAEWREYNRK